jgi:DNA polymerase I
LTKAKTLPGQLSMFAPILTDAESKWRPPEVLPQLDAHQWIWADTESTGLDLQRDRAIGYSYYLADGTRGYVPKGHSGGGNLDGNLVDRWLKKEWAGKDIVLLNAKHDYRMAKNDGIDFEALGCRIHDVSFQAALLDETRHRFNLDQLLMDVLGRHKDSSLKRDEKAHIAEMPAAMVGPYAEQDAQDVHDLDMAMRFGTNSKLTNSIQSDDLNRVLDLEDSIIYAVCEMEKNGVLIDRPKLERWVKEAEQRFSDIILELYRRVKFRVNPNSGDDMAQLFKYHGLQHPATDKGAPSFVDDFLETVKNEDVQMALKARRIGSLLSKYLKKYLKAIDKDNVLRYSLHQLRSTEESKGTISGRFSCAAPSRSHGANLQQVIRVKDQIRNIGPDWIVRELFIPAPGMVWTSSDAKQIEFRLFAHYANSPRINQRYAEDPNVDFHNVVLEMVRVLLPEFERQAAKTLNFSKVYGAGRDKIAAELRLPRSKSDVFVDTYEEELPEAGRLLNKCSQLATNRGFVKTYLGRLARFKKPSSTDKAVRMMEEIHYKPHSALNRILQGGAGDYMKQKIYEIHQNRKLLEYTERLTVHDETDGDQPPDPAKHKMMEELLNSQSHPFRIPLLWEVGTGANWKDAKK